MNFHGCPTNRYFTITFYSVPNLNKSLIFYISEFHTWYIGNSIRQGIRKFLCGSKLSYPLIGHERCYTSSLLIVYILHIDIGMFYEPLNHFNTGTKPWTCNNIFNRWPLKILYPLAEFYLARMKMKVLLHPWSTKIIPRTDGHCLYQCDVRC